MTTTHDYTQRTWGHDFAVTYVEDHGRFIDAHGWGRGIREGDYLILPNGETTTRYRVSHVLYRPDPTDMWSATLEFTPREAPMSRHVTNDDHANVTQPRTATQDQES